MANKSGKSFSGEDRTQPDHIRKEGIEKEEINENTGIPQSKGSRVGEQGNLQNRGFQEEQPENPVRNSGSLNRENQQDPAGEPEPDEV